MKKTLSLMTLLFLLVAVNGFCGENEEVNQAVVSDITANFEVPSDWKKVNSNLYVLRKFNKTFKQWNKFLSEGHQPWRLEPINTAAACLWDFGIKDNSDDIFKFANRLTEIKGNEVYMLKVGKRSYYIYIRVNKTIPIAYKLTIIEDKNK
jgi:hypothetical protein